MNIKILMMLKNEDDLVGPWIKYHGELFGYNNLFIFDNGSESNLVKMTLSHAESLGVRVRYDHNHVDDFLNKGGIFSTLIKDLDKNNPADFYFPLDCDEFLGVVDEAGEVCFDLESIIKILEPYKDFQGALAIGAAYDNNPVAVGYFRESPQQRKTFFGRGACEVLDHGFHAGIGKIPGEPIKTPVVYVHYHFKPFDLLYKHSMQKISPFINDLSPESLQRYADERLSNFHVVGHLLNTVDNYNKSFDIIQYRQLVRFIEAFQRINIPLPFNPEKLP